MRIAVPSETDQCLESQRSGHFGHTPYFTIVTIEDGKVVSAEAVKNVDHDAVGCGGVIEYAASLGLDAMITIGMGRPPFMRFTSLGIAVYREIMSPTVGGAIESFLNGGCQPMRLDQACVH